MSTEIFPYPAITTNARVLVCLGEMSPVGRAAAQRYSELLGDPKLITPPSRQLRSTELSASASSYAQHDALCNAPPSCAQAYTR